MVVWRFFSKQTKIFSKFFVTTFFLSSSVFALHTLTKPVYPQVVSHASFVLFPNTTKMSVSLWNFWSSFNIFSKALEFFGEISAGFVDGNVRIFLGYFLTSFFLVSSIVEFFQLHSANNRVVLALFQDSRYIVTPPRYLPTPTLDVFKNSGPTFSIIPPIKTKLQLN